MKAEKVLIKYIRKNGKNSMPIGVVVSTSLGEIGWSLCHKDDKWDKEKGKTIAINRAHASHVRDIVVPNSIKDAVNSMIERSKLYFGKKED